MLVLPERERKNEGAIEHGNQGNYLQNRISEEIRETESTISKFIEMVIMEHYEKGAVKVMEKGRTLAFQVSEELFQRVKEYLENYEKNYHRRLTQKEFVISLIEQALEEAEEEFEAARAAQEEARANRFNPLTGSFYGEADDTEAENPAESLEINEGEEIPAEGDDSDENCPDEDDEDVMPESWEQDMTRKKKPSLPTNPLKMKKPKNNLTNNTPTGLRYRLSRLRGCFHIDFSSRKRGDVH